MSSDVTDKPGCTSDFEMYALNHGKKYECDAARLFFSVNPGCTPIGSCDKQHSFTIKFREDTNPEREMQITATPDQIFYTEDGKARLLEIKCPYRKYLDQTDIRSEEEAWSLFADKHYIQCQIQMLITHIKKAILMFYVPNRDGSMSENAAAWQIDEDPDYQAFLLSNIEQAYKEIELEQTDRYPIFRNEGAYNRVATHQSKQKSCELYWLTFLNE